MAKIKESYEAWQKAHKNYRKKIMMDTSKSAEEEDNIKYERNPMIEEFDKKHQEMC